MKDRFFRMNEVIKYLSDVLKENELSDEELHNFVYYTITRIGVSDEEQKIDFFHDGTFDKIISDFNDKSTKAFVDPAWKYSCRIKNREEEFYDSEEEIKVYIPIDGDSMYRSSIAIFSFLDENGVPHVSNVGKNVRCDDIVCRFKNPEDVRKILDFLHDEKRVRGLLDPNPFAYSLNGIALVCDGNLSYNSIMTDIVCKYLNKATSDHSLGRTSVDEFIDYVKSYFIEHFINKENLEEVLGDFTIIEDSDNNLETNRKLVNVKNVLELFLKGLEEQFGFPDFVQEYQIRCDKDSINNEAISYKNARNKSFENKLSEVDEFLFKAVDIIMRREKFKDDEALDSGMSVDSSPNYEKKALTAINSFLSTDNVNYLTRADGLRMAAKEFDFASKLKLVLEDKKLSFFDYYFRVKEIKQERDLVNAIVTTYEKYQKKYESGFSDLDGIEFVSNSLQRLLMKGSYDGFTRDGNVRYLLSMFTRKEDAKRIMEQHLGRPQNDMDDVIVFVNDIINKNCFHV